MAIVPSIISGVSTGGFERNARPITMSDDQWRSNSSFVTDSCDPAVSYPNTQSLCDGILEAINGADPEDFDPKEDSTLGFETFYDWVLYKNIICETSDIDGNRSLERAVNKVNANRSAALASEFSDGVYSGSPSLRSSAVPLSSTAYGLTEAMSRLLDARVASGAGGTHVFHMPIALAPIASSLTLVSTEDYRIVFDDYVKSYIPDTNISGGGAATAPSGSQAWVGITGPYEVAKSEIFSDTVKTIDAKRNNTLLVQAEQHLYFRYETCNTFLAKVTVYS